MKIAILVGHNPQNQGAYNYLDESEFMFNRRIAKKLGHKLYEMKIRHRIFFRSQSNNIAAELTATAGNILSWERAPNIILLELHFNSAKSRYAKGCEVLALENDLSSILLADLLTDNISKVLKIKERHTNGVKIIREKNLGYKNLAIMHENGITTKVIVEPCFAGWRNEESKQVFENEDVYVTVLAQTIAEYLKGLK